MKNIKKLLVVIIMVAIVASVMTVSAHALVLPSFGQGIMMILTFPIFILDSIIWILTGVHVFYWR